MNKLKAPVYMILAAFIVVCWLYFVRFNVLWENLVAASGVTILGWMVVFALAIVASVLWLSTAFIIAVLGLMS